MSIKNSLAGHWWFMPIILVTQEADIRRIVVQSQPGQILARHYFKNMQQKKGLVEWQFKW
jgi:hypothetical protein